MSELESKEYSWRWVTANELLSRTPCELCCAIAYSDGEAIENTALYDGESTTGRLIANLNSGVKAEISLEPKEPIYCCRGLYVEIGENTEGVFVQWREIPQGIGYS
uniref:Uncharacterized protein n=1 Tax=viral metagenome TaxID=1070528 RepID=A0A6M3LVT2_9ZZZZ